ncbi:hypothetical protein D3C80_1449840 [compost metagenome]
MRLVQKFLGDNQRIIFVAAFEMQHHGIVQISLRIGATGIACKRESRGCLFLHIQLEECTPEKRIGSCVLSCVQQSIQNMQGTYIIALLVFLVCSEKT